MVRPLMTDTVFLAQKAQPADAGDVAVADDLLDTLKAHEDGCVGMAANMIGVNKAIIVFDNDGTPLEMFNPVILYRKTKRHRTIKVQWQDRTMQTHVKNFTGWTAQIIQHEVDHCNGILV